MWDDISTLLWGAFGVWFIYRLILALYHEFWGRANIHIAAANFSRSGRIEED